MSDMKEIRRYYNFDYLLHRAQHLPDQTSMKLISDFADLAGAKESNGMLINFAISALLVTNDNMYVKHGPAPAAYSLTKTKIKEIIDRFNHLAATDHARFNAEMIMLLKMGASKSNFDTFFDFEMNMLARTLPDQLTKENALKRS